MPGNTANKNRSPEERESQLTSVWELYSLGMTLTAIAKEIGCSRQQIRYDLTKLKERWYAENISAVNAHILRELAKLDHIEEEAWTAYYASIGVKREVTKESIAVEADDENGNKVPTGEQIETKKKEKTWREVGDARFLQIAMDAGKSRRELLGTDAPKKTLNFNKDIHDMSDEELNNVRAIERDRLNRIAASRADAPLPRIGPRSDSPSDQTGGETPVA